MEGREFVKGNPNGESRHCAETQKQRETIRKSDESSEEIQSGNDPYKKKEGSKRRKNASLRADLYPI